MDGWNKRASGVIHAGDILICGFLTEKGVGYGR